LFRKLLNTIPTDHALMSSHPPIDQASWGAAAAAHGRMRVQPLPVPHPDLWCDATVVVGMATFSVQTGLIMHAVAAPFFFAAISPLYFGKFNSPRLCKQQPLSLRL
jgi:hypothetical protein